MVCFHRSLDSGKHLKLSSNSAESSDSNYEIGKTTCTSTQFSIDTGSEIDASGQTYIAYFFAHNDQRFGTGADAKPLLNDTAIKAMAILPTKAK